MQPRLDHRGKNRPQTPEAIYSNPTTITDDQVSELHAFGYTDREIVDAVGIVALNVLTGAFNLIAGLEPDPPPKGQQSRKN